MFEWLKRARQKRIVRDQDRMVKALAKSTGRPKANIEMMVKGRNGW